MTNKTADVAIIGTGIVGIATAYFLAKNHGVRNIVLIDRDQPMYFTSAQSGENYRNWWPHPSMVALTNRSIDLLEAIARESGNRINMNRRGYSLATRETNIDQIIQELHNGLGEAAAHDIRYHENATSASYQPPIAADWETAPRGVDVLRNQTLIRKTFPSYADDIQSIIHIRRGGDISGQQLGMHMLEYLKATGATRITGKVEAINKTDEGYQLEISPTSQQTAETIRLSAQKLVNAAGPFAGQIAAMLDVTLPLYNTFQQKIAFEDKQKAIPRNMPFSIDLGGRW